MSNAPRESTFSKMLTSRMAMPEDIDQPERVFKAAKIKEESTPRSASPGASGSRTTPTKPSSSKLAQGKPPGVLPKPVSESSSKGKHPARPSRGKDSPSDFQTGVPAHSPKHLSKIISLLMREIPAEEDKRMANSSPGSLTEDGATKALFVSISLSFLLGYHLRLLVHIHNFFF